MEGQDRRAEAFAAFVEHQKRQEARERQRLAERGEVSLEFVRACEAEDPRTEDFQADMTEVSNTLKANGVVFSRAVMTFDSVDGTGFPLPEFTVLLKTLGPVAIGALGAVSGGWVQARYGRKVRVKIGDLEAEGRSVEEVKALLKMAQDYKVSSDAPTIQPRV